MSDLIKRKDGIEAHCELCPDQHICCPVSNGNICPDVEVFKLIPSAQPERPEQPESAKEYCAECNHIEMCRWYPYEGCEFRSLPSAQPERDIPVKPIETTDKSWGIPHRQTVCPRCDCYLGHVAFLGDYKGKRITYCETCGQAIDWEGWDFDG